MKLFKKFMKKKEEVYEYPWFKFYPEGKSKVDVEDISYYEYFERVCFAHKYSTAVNYFGEKLTFGELNKKIDLCARSLKCYGVRENDVVTIMMPNTPEAIIAFYAVNKVGAIANMVHPLSSEEELKASLIATKSVLLIAINIAYKKIDNIIEDTKIYKTVLVSPKDSMPKVMNFLYTITKDLKNKIPKSNEKYLYWNDFMERGNDYKKSVFVRKGMNDDAIYLHSGGTTGTPKNIVITNMSVNAIMDQAQTVFPKIGEDDVVLAILPMFHSFGLLVSIAAPLCMGSTIVMVPQFDAKRFDKLL